MGNPANIVNMQAGDMIPGDEIYFSPQSRVRVEQVTKTMTGHVGLYGGDGELEVFCRADNVLQVRPAACCDQNNQKSVQQKQMDWQDKLVIWSSVVCGVVCLAVLAWGPR